MNLHYVKGLDPVADAFSGTVQSDIVNMENYQKAHFVIYKGVGKTGTAAITVQACDDTSASKTKAISFRYKAITTNDTDPGFSAATTTGFSTTAGSSELYVIEVDADIVGSTGYKYVRLVSTEDANDPVLGGILIVMGDARYESDESASAIS